MPPEVDAEQTVPTKAMPNTPPYDSGLPLRDQRNAEQKDTGHQFASDVSNVSLNTHDLHNELAYVVPHFRQQGRLPPLHKPPQHVACTSIDAERVSIFENHQAHQHHADIQHLVILVKNKKIEST